LAHFDEVTAKTKFLFSQDESLLNSPLGYGIISIMCHFAPTLSLTFGIPLELHDQGQRSLLVYISTSSDLIQDKALKVGADDTFSVRSVSIVRSSILLLITLLDVFTFDDRSGRTMASFDLFDDTIASFLSYG
jgi:hypothetical protein